MIMSIYFLFLGHLLVLFFYQASVDILLLKILLVKLPAQAIKSGNKVCKLIVSLYFYNVACQ